MTFCLNNRNKSGWLKENWVIYNIPLKDKYKKKKNNGRYPFTPNGALPED